MTHYNDKDPSTSPLTDRQASSLLREGIAGPVRPVDDLILRLERTDGERWLVGAIARLNSWVDFPVEDAVSGRMSLAQAESLKDVTKRRMTAESSSDGRLAGLLGYFIALGGALAHHGKLIASRSREEVDNALVDLAEACPEPWRSMLHDAAMRDR